MASTLTTNFRKHAVPLGLVFAAWLLLVFAINPSGSFPLNDDWNYARTVKALLEEHQLIVTQWSLAASLTHTLIGCIACLPFGFSFEALRASTVVMGLGCAASMYFLSMRAGATRALSALTALVFCSSPLFLNLSVTFMTDVPFLCFSGLSLLLLSKLFDGDRPSTLRLAATATCVASACLMRQTGLVIPIAFAIVYLIRARKFSEIDLRQRLLIASAPLITSLVCVTAFQLWLGHTVGSLYSYRVEEFYLRQKFAKGPLFVLSETASNSLNALIYLGLFTLPMMPLIFPRFIRQLNKAQRFLALALCGELGLFFVVGLLMMNAAMPLADNVFFNLGLGPLLLGLDDPMKQSWPAAPNLVMLSISIVGGIGGSLLISILATLAIRARKKEEPFTNETVRAIVVLCLTIAALYLTLVCVRGFFDRYLLFPLSLLLPVLAACSNILPSPGASEEPQSEAKAARAMSSNMLGWAAAVALLLPLAVFGVAGTHDYFAWNRARWQAANDLIGQHKTSEMDVDGGLEFNGWFGYDPRYRNAGGVAFSTSMKHGDKYAITLIPHDNYEVVQRYGFTRWLPAGKGEILVLKKKD